MLDIYFGAWFIWLCTTGTDGILFTIPNIEFIRVRGSNDIALDCAKDNSVYAFVSAIYNATSAIIMLLMEPPYVSYNKKQSITNVSRAPGCIRDRFSQTRPDIISVSGEGKGSNWKSRDNNAAVDQHMYSLGIITPVAGGHKLSVMWKVVPKSHLPFILSGSRFHGLVWCKSNLQGIEIIRHQSWRLDRSKRTGNNVYPAEKRHRFMILVQSCDQS